MFVDTKLWLISNFSSFIANAIRTCRCNYSWFHMPLLTTLQSSLANWVLRSSQYNCKLGNQIANFETYLSTLVLLNFITSYLFLKPGNCNIMNPNPFTKQGKGYRVRPVKWFTADKWLEGSKPFQVVHQLKLMEKDGNKYCRSVRTYRKVLQVQYVYYGNTKTVHQKLGYWPAKVAGCNLHSGHLRSRRQHS